ncbi:MAG: sulfite exporter TauE/SafE family protein [Boseongicola sp.]|nr:sulfite exporter TauE/SafE family protein [Boseongicola sp.]
MTGFLGAVHDFSELLPLAATLIISGAAIGLLAGLFGVGGGAISVPVFYEAFLTRGLDPDGAMPLAVGTSLAMMVPTAILSAWSHTGKSALDAVILRRWALPVFLGVAAGSAIARVAPAELFQIVFAGVASVMAAKLILAKRPWVLRDSMPAGIATGLYGSLVGLLSALMGIGGGAISNLILTLHGFSVHRAIGTSAGVGVLVAVPGSAGYILAGWEQPHRLPDALGFVSLGALIFSLPVALLTTRLGVRLAHALPRHILSRLLGVFLALVSLRFFLLLL